MCRIKFLKEEGEDISREDVERAKMEIGALNEGTFVPSDAPYHCNLIGPKTRDAEDPGEDSEEVEEEDSRKDF